MGVTRTVWLDGLPYRATPLLRPAAAETLQLIQAEPGVNASEIAHRRNVTPRAAHDTVMRLERVGLIRTELDTDTRYGTARRCYPLEAP